MLKKVTRSVIPILLVLQSFLQPITHVSANEPVSLASQIDQLENGHDDIDLLTWDEEGNIGAVDYHEDAHQFPDDLSDLDLSAYYMEYEPFRPYYDAPPEPMSAFEITAHAEQRFGYDREGNPLPASRIHTIANQAQLRNFLNGTLGGNDDHFQLTADITLATGTSQFLTRGRPGVFTGVFEGHGNTISALRLRHAGTATGVENSNIGFVRRAGDGAVIRNLNFYNDAFGSPDTRLGNFTDTTARGIGTLIGAVEGGGVVSLHNIHIISRGQSLGAEGAPAGNRPSVTFDNVGANSQSDVGGLVGRVQANTTLNITDVKTERMTFVMMTGGHSVRTTGGLVGAVHGGTVNITTRNDEMNQVDTSIRASTVGSGTFNGVNNGADLAGGVVGHVFSGHLFVSNTTVMASRNQAEPIRGRSQVGGILGGLDARGTVRLENVENRAMLIVMRNGGDNTTNGRVGGLVGRAAGTLHIYNSRNFGLVQHRGQNAAMGGLLGYSGTSSRIVINGGQNGQNPAESQIPIIAGSGLPAAVGQHSGNIFHRDSVGGANNSTAAAMGGIVGRSRGSIFITNSTNFANFTKGAVGNGATPRNNTRVGGIIGRIHPVGGQTVYLENVTNHGNIAITPALGSIGGIMGDLMTPPRGVAAVSLINPVNHGNITGGTESGGIVGWIRPRNVLIDNALNTGNIVRGAQGGSGNDAAGIVGRSGGEFLRIINSENRGNVHTDTAVSLHTGGIVGRSTGARLTLVNVLNSGNIRGRDHVGGILGFANGNDAIITRAVNHGSVSARRNGGSAAAAGIVGRSSRRNMIIREAGNFGAVTMVGNNNGTDGAAGILGFSNGANTVIERSFNQGAISGRNSAGGIVGRNLGNLNITDVYNIGSVAGGTQNGAPANRAGNGILGRRASGTIRITRAFVSARVGGYAVATQQAGTGQQATTALVTGMTFNNVFIDESAFVAIGTGFTAANPATQVNRNGINLTDTELLTSGHIAAFTTGAWRTGIAGLEGDEQRTYPYLAWQVEAGLQPEFFTSIRTQHVIDGQPRMRPVMDVDYVNSPIEIRGAQAGSRVFNNYVANGFTEITGDHTFTLNRQATTSIGLISPNGVVGFETREISGRIILFAYDSLFGAAPNRDIIGHARFEVASTLNGNREPVDLNGMFLTCTVEVQVLSDCPLDSFEDTSTGTGILMYEVIEANPPQVISGLRPALTTHNQNNYETVTPEDLETYTVIRISALGYAPVYRVINLADLDELGNGLIHVPMNRVPFNIRTFVPQAMQGDEGEAPAAQENWLIAPPGGRAATGTPLNARPGFGLIPGLNPGSWLANRPNLTWVSQTEGQQLFSPEDTVETGISGQSGHFNVEGVMWGDQLIASADLHDQTTLNSLRYEQLLDRNINVEFPSSHDQRILDLDLYVQNIGLPQMYVRFVEETTYDDNGFRGQRALTLSGGGTVGNPMPNIQNVTVNHPENLSPTVVRQVTAPLAVPFPRPGRVTFIPPFPNDPTGTGGGAFQNAHNQNLDFTINAQHFRITDLVPEATLTIIDESGVFAPLVDVPVSQFITYVYPLINAETGDYVVISGSELNRESIVLAADYGDPILVRTLTIPLTRLVTREVRVYELLEDGTYALVEDAQLTHNSRQMTPQTPGVFTINQDEHNRFMATAEGFIDSEPLDIFAGGTDNLMNDIIAEFGHIRIVLERLPEPDRIPVHFDLTDVGLPHPDADENQFATQMILPLDVAVDPTVGGEAPIHISGGSQYVFAHWARRLQLADEEYAYIVWGFDTPITEEITLVARFTPIFEVTFGVATGGLGVLSPSGVVLSVELGNQVAQSLVPQVIPDARYEFSHWVSNAHPDVTFENDFELSQVEITQDTHFEAVLTRQNVIVTFDLRGGIPENNNEVPFEDQLIPMGQPATQPTATLSFGDETFIGWAIRLHTGEDDAGEAVYTYILWDFELPFHADTTLYAMFTPIRQVTFEASESGGGRLQEEGTVLLITAGDSIANTALISLPIADEGYEFAYWTSNQHSGEIFGPIITVVEGEESQHIVDPNGNLLYPLSITEDTVFTAHFRRRTALVLFGVYEQVLIDSDGEPVYNGSDEPVLFTGGQLVPGANEQLDFSVAMYETIGSIGAQNLPTPVPEEGFKFAHWMSEIGEQRHIYTTEALLEQRVYDQETVIHAIFLPIYLTFEVLENDLETYGGTLTAVIPATETVILSGEQVPYDATVIFTATPDEGYQVLYWTLNGQVVEEAEDSLRNWMHGMLASGEIQNHQGTRFVLANIGTSQHVTVTFKRQLVDITYDYEGLGSVAAQVVDGDELSDESVMPGSDVIFTATPARGYQIARWYVNDIEVSSDTETTLRINNIQSDIHVTVVFEPIPVYISFDANPIEGGEVTAYLAGESLESGTRILYGSTVTFRATANPDFTFASWRGLIEGGQEIIIEDITADLHMVAEFARDNVEASLILELTEHRTQAPNLAGVVLVDWLVGSFGLVATSTIYREGEAPIVTSHLDGLIVVVTDLGGNDVQLDFTGGGQYIVTVYLPTSVTNYQTDLSASFILTLVGERP